MQQTNWARIIAQALVDSAVTHFFISPGYRDAPLIAALQSCDGVTLVSCFDERAAGFAAVTFAKAAERPAALICTSGTAGANYLPAVVEAHASQVPLIVLTCDRPIELVKTGANQTTEQLSFFSGFAKSVYALESVNPAVEPVRLFELIFSGLRAAVEYPAGPVHFNVPLRAPLEPHVSQTEALAPARAERSKRFAAPSALHMDISLLRELQVELPRF